MSIGISQTDFYQKIKTPLQQPHNPYPYGCVQPVAEPSPELAIKVVLQCLDCANPGLAAKVIEALETALCQSSFEAQKRAELVLLPMIPRLNAEIKKRTPPPAIPLTRLMEIAVKTYLDSIVGGSIARDKVSLILQAVSAGGNPGILSSLLAFYPNCPRLSALLTIDQCHS